jgi:hypothetical protein
MNRILGGGIREARIRRLPNEWPSKPPDERDALSIVCERGMELACRPENSRIVLAHVSVDSSFGGVFVHALM